VPTVSREVIAVIDGIPTIINPDADIWGTGTIAARPVSGVAAGDLYFVQDPPLYRIDIWDGAAWVPVTVIGPSGGSVDNRLARFDGTTGTVIQNSGVTLDDSDFVSGVNELKLDTEAGTPSAAGALRYNGTSWQLRDSAGTFDPRSGSGISEAGHKVLRQLIHLADGGGPFEGFTSGAYLETLPSADPFPTSWIWWTDSGKTDKIVEETVTYNANKTINTDEWKVYDTDGSTVLATVTDTITYSGVFETSRTRTIA